MSFNATSYPKSTDECPANHGNPHTPRVVEDDGHLVDKSQIGHAACVECGAMLEDEVTDDEAPRGCSIHPATSVCNASETDALAEQGGHGGDPRPGTAYEWPAGRCS